MPNRFQIGLWIVSLSFFMAGPMGAYAQETETLIKDAPEIEAEEEFLDLRDPFQSALPKISKLAVVPDVSDQDEFIYESTDQEESGFDYASLDVAGVVWGLEKPRAIINEEVVGIGDVVGGATIIKIDNEGILLKHNEREYLLKRGHNVKNDEGFVND